MDTISACLVVYREQDRIEGCLESLAGVVDEVVVVHDGPCDDMTLAIARRYTDKVLETDNRTGDADFVRPFALEQCTGEWVLIIDADERLSPALRQQLRSLVRRAEVDAYGFDWPYVDERGARIATSGMSSKKFLFRRSRMYTTGLPHMTPDTYGVSRGVALDVYHLLGHRFGQETFRRLLSKNRRRGRAAAERLAEGVETIRFYNASASDRRVKNVRKIRLLARHPMVALCVIPAWGFFYWYLLRGHIRAGWMGLHDSLNLPVYYAAFAVNMIRLRTRGG